MLSPEQLRILHDKYLELVRLEVEQFGVKPTEVRHLIGRLGEFHCALEVGGTLAHVANQHGFDVVSPAPENKRISVKTTAQTAGFVNIGSENTINKAEELMVLQYQTGKQDQAGKLSVIFHGPIALAKAAARPYKQYFELELSKARRLMQDITSTQPDRVVTPPQNQPDPGMQEAVRDDGTTPTPPA